MTGLDPTIDTILSISCFITNAHLTLLDPDGLHLVIYHPQHILDKMSEWCLRTHTASGLVSSCLSPSTSTTPQEAARSLLAYIKYYIPQPRTGVLAGNSVHMDRAFLTAAKGGRPYGDVVDLLHYRILDVSSIKEAARRWAGKEVLARVPRKKGLHQAREDVLESLEECRFYREVLFSCSKRKEGEKGEDGEEGGGGVI